MVTSSQAKRIIFPHLFLYLELRKSERKRSNYPTQTPSVAAGIHVGNSYQLTRGLVTYDTEARDNRHEDSLLPLRAGDGLLQGDKGNGGEGGNAISLSAATASGRRGEWIMVRGLMHVLMGGAQAEDEGLAFMRLVIAHDASGGGAVWGFVVAMAKLVDYDGKEVVALGTIV